jgi:hypothetical protein
MRSGSCIGQADGLVSHGVGDAWTSRMSRVGWKRILGASVLVLGGAIFVAQLVPYGRDHTNPPTIAEPRWDSPTTRLLAQRACFDCHSNETRWPWYSNVAPTSWLLQAHVDEGRRVLNFSEFVTSFEDADEAGEAVREQSMPPRSYLVLHPEARLSPAERQALARGLDASIPAARTD